MPDMTPENALNSLRKMKTVFREFEYLEEIIVVALGEQRRLNKVKKERGEVQGEVDALEPILTSLKARVKVAEKASEVAEKKADRLQSENTRAASKLAAGLKQEAATEMEALNAIHADRIASCNSEITALKEERDRIDAEVNKFRKSLQRLRAQLGQVA